MSALEKRNFSGHEDHWIPLSDLMTGLMMIFLLIAITYMIKVEADKKTIKDTSDRITNIATLYKQLERELYNDLRVAFEKDFAKWDAELLADATIRFKAPDVLFDSGRFEIKQRFRDILGDFFPRYVDILSSQKYRDAIQEVRIEGHTSRFWQSALSEHEIYFKNLQLSQDRTRSTLEYVMNLPGLSGKLDWLRRHVTANGLSYSHPIANLNGSENAALSQRVEFRVRTDAESRIERIIEVTK